MNKNSLYLILFGLLLLPVGCMVGPKYIRPESEKVENFANAEQPADTTKSITNLNWVEMYNDEVLKELINTGIDNNLDLKISITRLDRAKAELGYSKADLFPSFQYSGTINTNSKSLIPSRAGLGMSWELDFWGKVRHENKALQAQLLATEEARKVVLTNVICDISTAYFELRNYDNQLEITQKTLEARRKAYEIINSRFLGGQVSEVDKVQIEQQVAIAEANIPLIKRQITRLENVISILLGQMPHTIKRGKSTLELEVNSKIPVSLPSTLLENRPDVKQAELLYMSTNERIGVAQAMRFPSFDIGALFGFANSNLSELFMSNSLAGNASASVTGAIFNFGKNKRRVEIYRKTAEEAKFSYNKSILNAVSEVEQALQDVRTYKEEWDACNRQVNAARKNLVLSEVRYYNGYVSYLEVLDVQTRLFNAELSLSQLASNKQASMVNLYKSLGGGWN